MVGGWVSFENIFYFFFGVVATLILALLRSISGSRKIYRFTTVDIVLTLFVSYVIARTILINYALWENEPLLIFIALYSLFFVYKTIFCCNAQVFQLFLVGFPGLALLASGHGILQYLGIVESNSDLFNITGTFVNPQIYGGYLASLLPFTFALYYYSKNLRRERFFTHLSWVSIAFLLIALVLSQSRAAWLASIVSVAFLLQYQSRWFAKVKLLVKQPVVLIGLSIGVLFFFGSLIFLKLDSAAGRLLIWRVSLPMWWDNLLLGIGYGQFKVQYLDYQAAFFTSYAGLDYAEKIAGMTHYAFNEFLQISIELGVIGLILFLILLIVIFSPISSTNVNLANRRWRGVVAQSCIINILIFSLFSYPFSILPIHLHFFVSLALLSSVTDTQYMFTLRKPIFIAAILVCIVFGQLQWKRFQATKQWRQAASTFSFDRESAIAQYEKVYHTLNYKGEFLYNYGAELSEASYAIQSIDVLEQAKEKFNHLDLHLYLGKSYQEIGEVLKAEQAFLHAKNMIPHRFLPRYLLVKLYQDMGASEKAVLMAKSILNMEEKVPSNIVQEIKSEMKEFLSKGQL
ncbi:MAG: O-antigen ligase family protein [Cyclobacteriaceae bacterium]